MATSVMPQFQSNAVPRRRSAVRPMGDATNAGDQAGAINARLQTGVDAYTANAREGMQRDVGQLLGNLNAIGGIRTGGVKTGVQDIARTTSTAIGREAAQTAVQGEQIAQGAANEAQRRKEAEGELAFSREKEVTRAGEAQTGFGIQREGMTLEDRRAANELTFQREKLGQESALTREKIGLEANAQKIQNAQFEKRLQFDTSTEAGRIAQQEADRRQHGEEFGRRLQFDTSTEAGRIAQAEADRKQRESQFGVSSGIEQQRVNQQGAQYQSDLEFRRQGAAEDRRRYEQERQDAQKAAKAKRKAGILGTIGRVVGTVAGGVGGFLLGGPAGAIAGAGIGQGAFKSGG